MSYARFIRKIDFLIIVFSILLFIACGYYVARLRIKSDFKEMLPNTTPSVVELNRIEKRVRSTDNLIVMVGGSDWPKMRVFIDDLVTTLRRELGDDIHRIEYNTSEAKEFYDRNKYLYIDLEDLKEVYSRLKTRIDWEKVKQTPFFINIAEEEPKFDISDIEEKYRSKVGKYQHYEDGYFTTETADLAAIVLWPREGATNVEFSQHLIGRIKEIIPTLPSYDPSIKVGFGGRIKKMIAGYQAIIGDIFKTTILCAFLISAVVLLYYRKLRMGFLMMTNVAQGTLVALAAAYFLIGHLTSQTAFLGSIIVGNGINYSLIFMARYLEERRDKMRTILESLSTALRKTWRPTFVAALTTSVSFAALAFTKVRGFSQFGIIGGMGMMLCWFSTFFILPAWLSISERVWEISSQSKKTVRFSVMKKFASFPAMRPYLILVASAVLSVVFIGTAAWYFPKSLEYDFSKLGFKTPPEHDKWEEKSRDRMGEVFGQSTSPSVIVLNRVDQGRFICDDILARDPENRYVESCKTIYTFIPEDQDKKLSILANVRELLSGSTLKFLNPEQLAEVEKFRKTFNLKKLTPAKLPDGIADMFTDIDGNRGILAYVYPKANLWDGRELTKFADLIREVKLPDGDVIRSSGQPVIFADLLDAVVTEGPKVTLLSFILVLILIYLNFLNPFRKFRRLSNGAGRRSVMFVMSSLLIGVLWLIGLMGVLDIKLNFLNFIALPITFGIGVDYAVNIYQRYREEGVGGMGRTLASTGGAVVLCSLTTIIGYSVLLTSRSQALASFGLVALLGEFTCLTAALVSLPALIVWWEGRKTRRR